MAKLNSTDDKHYRNFVNKSKHGYFLDVTRFTSLSEGTDYCTLNSQNVSVELTMLTTRRNDEFGTK